MAQWLQGCLSMGLELVRQQGQHLRSSTCRDGTHCAKPVLRKDADPDS